MKTKKLKLFTKGSIEKFAIIDAEDFEWLSKYSWRDNIGYVGRWEKTPKKSSLILMHREIMKAPVGMVVDHINGLRNDNRKENLRVCTQAENLRNRKLGVDNTSGYKGVSQIKTTGRWKSEIYLMNKKYNIGVFDTALDAGLAYNAVSRLIHGEFGQLNIIKQ